MKRTLKAANLIIAAILCIVSLVSCSEKEKEMTSSDNGTFICEGVTYKCAPVGYEPTYVGEEYATLDGKLKETLYRVGNEDPEMWLTTEFSGATTTVYYNSKTKLPTLSEMAPELCYICMQEENAAAIYLLGDTKHQEKETEKEIIDKIISLISDEETETELWDTKDFIEVYQLKFHSEKWSAIYYNLVYGVTTDGYFVFDRASGKCVDIGNILAPYHENTANEEN